MTYSDSAKRTSGSSLIHNNSSNDKHTSESILPYPVFTDHSTDDGSLSSSSCNYPSLSHMTKTMMVDYLKRTQASVPLQDVDFCVAAALAPSPVTSPAILSNDAYSPVQATPSHHRFHATPITSISRMYIFSSRSDPSVFCSSRQTSLPISKTLSSPSEQCDDPGNNKNSQTLRTHGQNTSMMKNASPISLQGVLRESELCPIATINPKIPEQVIEGENFLASDMADRITPLAYPLANTPEAPVSRLALLQSFYANRNILKERSIQRITELKALTEEMKRKSMLLQEQNENEEQVTQEVLNDLPVPSTAQQKPSASSSPLFHTVTSQVRDNQKVSSLNKKSVAASPESMVTDYQPSERAKKKIRESVGIWVNGEVRRFLADPSLKLWKRLVQEGMASVSSFNPRDINHSLRSSREIVCVEQPQEERAHSKPLDVKCEQEEVLCALEHRLKPFDQKSSSEMSRTLTHGDFREVLSHPIEFSSHPHTSSALVREEMKANLRQPAAAVTPSRWMVSHSSRIAHRVPCQQHLATPPDTHSSVKLSIRERRIQQGIKGMTSPRPSPQQIPMIPRESTMMDNPVACEIRHSPEPKRQYTQLDKFSHPKLSPRLSSIPAAKLSPRSSARPPRLSAALLNASAVKLQPVRQPLDAPQREQRRVSPNAQPLSSSLKQHTREGLLTFCNRPSDERGLRNFRETLASKARRQAARERLQQQEPLSFRSHLKQPESFCRGRWR